MNLSVESAATLLMLALVSCGAAATAHAAPAVSSVQPNQPAVTGGDSLSVAVALDSPAPPGGQLVSLNYSPDAPLRLPPPTVTVPALASTAHVTLLTLPTTTSVAVTVSAVTGKSAKSAGFKILKPEVAALALWRQRQSAEPGSLAPEAPEPIGSSVNGGIRATLQIVLGGNAPAGGTGVTVTFTPGTGAWWCVPAYPGAWPWSNCVAAGQHAVTIPGGSRSASLPLHFDAVREARTLTIGASAGVARSRSLQVLPPRVHRVNLGMSCASPLPSISTVPGATTLVATIYSRDPQPSEGAFADLAITAGGKVPRTVQFANDTRGDFNCFTGYDGRLMGCDPHEMHQATSDHAEHFGCVYVTLQSLSPLQRTVTLNASAGGTSASAAVTVQGLASR